jgi:NDP-sugar pyrophosphorylase family protein
MTTCKQAVLLAAGSGTRLLPLTATRPKCMVEVAGRPIVDGLVESLAAIGVEELVVVTGYCAGALRAHLGRRRGGLAISYVDNPDYATTNNIVSLHLARPLVRPPFLLLESDVEAEPAVVASIAAPDRMAVAAYDHTMSGTGVRISAGARVTEMILGAHTGDTTGVYKTVNFYSFSGPVWDYYAARLAAWVAAGRVNDYYEAVLADLINTRKLTMTAADVSLLRWYEIDDATDLARATFRGLVRRSA